MGEIYSLIVSGRKNLLLSFGILFENSRPIVLFCWSKYSTTWNPLGGLGKGAVSRNREREREQYLLVQLNFKGLQLTKT